MTYNLDYLHLAHSGQSKAFRKLIMKFLSLLVKIPSFLYRKILVKLFFIYFSWFWESYLTEIVETILDFCRIVFTGAKCLLGGNFLVKNFYFSSFVNDIFFGGWGGIKLENDC